MKNKEELKSWFEDDKLYVGEYVKHKINQLDEPEEITEEQAYDKIAETFPVTTKEMVSVLEKYYLDMFIEFSEEKIEALKQTAEKVRNGGIVPKQEVLSQEWIGEHRWNNRYIGRPFVYVDDLQNLLVPKQEKVEEGRVRLIVGFDGGTESYYATDIEDALDFLTDYDGRFTVSKEPIIPKFVAKWISEHHERFDLYPALRRLEEGSTRDYDAYKWYRRNTHKFVNAYLTGKYEVEEEPLYRARLKVITDEFIASYLRTQSSDAEDRLKALEIGSKYIHEDYRHLSEFTEDELKRLDIWDSKQWELEELEE